MECVVQALQEMLAHKHASERPATNPRWRAWTLCVGLFLVLGLQVAPSLPAQQQPLSWQAQVRKYCDASDWAAALGILEGEIARAPQDLDLKAWRARVLTWAGRLNEAEHEYREILAVDTRDPDNWAGLATVCLRQGKIEEARRAAQMAVQLDPSRADLRDGYDRIVRAGHAGETHSPTKAGRVYSNDLRVGIENDSLSYAPANRGQGIALLTRLTPAWGTSVGEMFYQRSGILAEKFMGCATLHAPSFAAITAGGAFGGNNPVIPKSEAFFDLDRGFSRHDSKIVKGMELDYAQHWYWYQAARILTLNGTTIIYLPRDWSLTLAAIGARSAFSGTGVEWRPSGSTRLGFPLAAWSRATLSGNIFFAAGAENFASADQIGRFSSQTYGGGMHLELSSRMYATFTYSYQKRTQNRSDSYTGAGYGIRF